MTKLELIEILSTRFSQVKGKQVKDAVYTTIDAISSSLEEGDRIEIRGFGSFSLHHRESRRGRNPKTGESVMIAAKSIPHFRAGKEMRERINSSRTNVDIKGDM